MANGSDRRAADEKKYGARDATVLWCWLNDVLNHVSTEIAHSENALWSLGHARFKAHRKKKRKQLSGLMKFRWTSGFCWVGRLCEIM